MSICDGIDDLIDRSLDTEKIGKPPYYKKKRICQNLSKESKQIDFKKLLDGMLSCLEQNCEKAGCLQRRSSKENWRWKPMLEISEANTSPEKLLEKAIVNLKGQTTWINQVPTASGLVNGRRDRHRNIDLAHKIAEQEFEFVELKVASNTPLHAAMEILLYGVLYVFARQNQDEIFMSDELRKVKAIHLVVLAPHKYYKGYDLDWLRTAINDGLRLFVTDRRLPFQMDFEFKEFPDLLYEKYVEAILGSIDIVKWDKYDEPHHPPRQ